MSIGPGVAFPPPKDVCTSLTKYPPCLLTLSLFVIKQDKQCFSFIKGFSRKATSSTVRKRLFRDPGVTESGHLLYLYTTFRSPVQLLLCVPPSCRLQHYSSRLRVCILTTLECCQIADLLGGLLGLNLKSHCSNRTQTAALNQKVSRSSWAQLFCSKKCTSFLAS